MSKLKLKIITPKSVALEKEIDGVTLPSSEGEMTILPRHINLFALLEEGIVHYWAGDDSEYLAIGGGYVETNGEEVSLLVSRAYGQEGIDQQQTQLAMKDAKERMKSAKSEDARKEISSLLRRSAIDAKLLKKKRRKSI
ncbi:MAG: ATP synthase F1 subunit epsilon [Microgenomates group bacterium]